MTDASPGQVSFEPPGVSGSAIEADLIRFVFTIALFSFSFYTCLVGKGAVASLVREIHQR